MSARTLPPVDHKELGEWLEMTRCGIKHGLLVA